MQIAFLLSRHFQKKKQSDEWSCLLTVREFKEKISNYDYILFANPSEEFINYFIGSLNYNAQDAFLFKIIKDKDLLFEKM